MLAIPRQPRKAETLFSLLILATLAAIGLVMFSVQTRFNPAVDNFTSQAGLKAAPDIAPAAESLAMPLTEGIEAMSPAERFTPDTLSNKINGKAELYLSAGFLELQTQRFRPTDDPGTWFEVFIYNMGTPSNAFAVFSTQRRSDVQKVPLTQHAYQTANALFFTAAGNYVEMIAASTGSTVAAILTAFAENYLDHLQLDDHVQVNALDPAGLFPDENMVADSVTLIAKDAFGFSLLDQVYTAQYHEANTDMNLFVSLRASPAEAKALAEAYRDFLIEFGGIVKSAAEGSMFEGVFIIEVMDAFELIFSRGPYLAGVHMAEDVEAAARLALKLDRQLVSP